MVSRVENCILNGSCFSLVENVGYCGNGENDDFCSLFGDLESVGTEVLWFEPLRAADSSYLYSTHVVKLRKESSISITIASELNRLPPE